MTFKHVKFQDSAVMRSLERVAREKGLVKEEELTKTASTQKKADLTPSSNLLVNLLKLSEGLRQAGLDKYADELEAKTLAYKQAQTLYETSKEEGEDLVDAAHPKGSHKLENVDGDDLAVVETIIDQHLKNMKVVEKEPTGKLDSSASIINNVKMVLGENFLAQKGSSKLSLGQEASKKPESGVGSAVGSSIAELVGLVIASKGLKWVWSKLASSGADKEFLKQMSGDLGRKLTRQESKVWGEKIVAKIGEKRAEQFLLEKGAQQAAKGVAQQAAKSVVPELGKAGLGAAEREAALVGAQTVAKSPGVWSRLMGILGSAGSTASAIGATEIGGGTLTGGVAGLAGAGAAGIAALSAAAIIGAIAGGIGGYYLFEHYYNVDDLKQAGENLISESEDVKSDFPEYRYVDAFQRNLNQIVAKYPIIGKIKSGEPLTEASLKQMKEVNDLIYESRKNAGAILGYANSYSDEQFMGWIRGFKDVALAAKNYLELAMKINAAFDSFAADAANKAAQKVQEAKKQQVAAGGGEAVVSLQKSYKDTLQEIDKYLAIIAAKRLPNGADLTKWLNKAKRIVASEEAQFNQVAEANRPSVANIYADRLNNKLKPKVKAFADKWIT